MHGLRLRRHQNGDTIVEVLIALVVISVVLVGAYVSSNKSFNNSRQAEERGQALKYLEGQLEQLKAGSLTGATVFSTANYCFAPNGTLTTLNGAPASDVNADNFGTGPSDTYPAVCTTGGIAGGYHLSIVQNNPIFTVRARWERAGGGGREEAKIVYKINQ